MSRVIKCPICRTAVPWEGNPHRPFCSERCRLIDLGAWTEERYRIPREEPSEKSGEDNGQDGEGSG